MLRLCGADWSKLPPVPYSNPNNYQHVGRRLPMRCAERAETA